MYLMQFHTRLCHIAPGLLWWHVYARCNASVLQRLLRVQIATRAIF